jgi:hypothetical protein
MKHATAAALDQIDALLQRVRDLETLKERTRGVFYRGSTAFLHFHEDPAGMFADLRTDKGWERYPVNRASDQASLVRMIKASLLPRKQDAIRKTKAS